MINGFPEITRLAKQLSEISKSVRTELDSINRNFAQVEDESVVLETLVENNFETKFEANLQKFSESIVSVVKILNSDNAQVESILKENGEFGNQLAVDIQTSIEKVKYYDFFEQVIEEIILELNNIYLTIKSGSVSKTEDEALDLESLKKRYTMQSQRTIHSRVLNEFEETSAVEEEEDNIEFF
jgi:ABC-type transporter Mla subunit MlaD